LTPSPAHRGFVWLVGAGPGDPGLITAAGLRRLREADAIVFDALANPLLLDEARPDAQRIDVGKRGGSTPAGSTCGGPASGESPSGGSASGGTQDQINALLVELAQQGQRVVRLKGGDPLLFGRGAEEAAHLARHGIPCEVIPGVTSGIAAPASAGIPVTHRDHASSVTFVTGHEQPGKRDSAVDYAALARLVTSGGTACFYMGVGRLAEIAQTLTAHGLDRDTPAAIVQWGTLPRQRAARGTIATLADVVRREGIDSPAIIVVGAVAAYDDGGLDHFTQRPLFGRRVLVTRTRQQASVLRQKLADLGADVLEAPTIELVPPGDWRAVDAAVRDVRGCDWLLLTSAHAVNALAERLAVLRLDARHLAGVKVAAIGDATAAALRQRLGIAADLVPTRFVGESLAGELIAKQDIAGRRVLLLRADIARPALPRLLTEAGAAVTEVVAYHTRMAASLPAGVLDALRAGRVDWVTFTSSSTATNLAALLGAEVALLERVRIASIGPITSATVRELGLTVAVEAQAATVDALVAAIGDATSRVASLESASVARQGGFQ